MRPLEEITLHYSDEAASKQPGSSPVGRLLRLKDEEAKDSGQFGFSARYYARQLNNTEFGAYFMNYHSRTPILSGIAAGGAINLQVLRALTF